MRRTIVNPADLAGLPLDELKAWLSISRDAEDDALLALLQTSLEMCEAYTGLVPLYATVQESLAAKAGISRLLSRPVRAVNSASAVTTDGTKQIIDPALYEVDVDADGRACVEIRSVASGSTSVIVEVLAGLSSDWSGLAASLRQGIIRLAAYLYRDRDQTEAIEIPASVTALWQPWRQVSLA